MMKCEPWMDEAPRAPKSPLQQAQDDMRHWKAELDRAERRAEECRKEYNAAADRVARF